MKQSMKSLLAAVVLVSVSAAASAQNVVKATFVEGTKPDGREGAAKVADGRKSTKWCIDEPNQMPYYVILSAGEQPIQLQEYIFTTADDTDMYPERNPCSWTVYGSNDKTNWKVVDEKHSNLRMGDLNEQEYFFPVKTKGTYRYFKFVFYEMQEGTRIQLSEIGLAK